MNHPYIGITGFVSAAEVKVAITSYRDACATTRRDPTHDLMVGVLASSKTLDGEANKYPLRYPKRERIFDVFPACSTCDGHGIQVFTPMNSSTADDVRVACPECSGEGPRFKRVNLVHYATGGVGSEPYEIGSDMRLAEALTRAMAYGGPRCDGLQINCAWPDPRGIKLFRAGYPYARLVLQLGPGALGTMQYRPRAIAERVRDDYGDLVTDVLVDVSGGRGVQIEGFVERAGLIVEDLRRHGEWRVGIAGGLCAETLAPWGSALRSGRSIDAEGRLRDDADGGGNLDLVKVGTYLRAAVQLAGGAA